ncbi:uncharacterized protein LOC135842674 [Planococcus citri]|uniref:uncharacterized protein LOC135842674 n=1 Tax=Planococcus citri TaxID=170843 RepID=UPI0031FA24FC
MPIVNSCCICCSLRTGTIIILIVTILSTGYISVGNKLVEQLSLGFIKSMTKKIAVAYLVCALLGIFAVCVERAKFFIPVLIGHAVILIVYVGLTVLILFNGSAAKPTDKPLDLGSHIISTILQFYFFIVLYSYYQELTGKGE